MSFIKTLMAVDNFDFLKFLYRINSTQRTVLCWLGRSFAIIKSVGAPRIELGLPAPKAGVLPVYYAPF